MANLNEGNNNIEGMRFSVLNFDMEDSTNISSKLKEKTNSFDFQDYKKNLEEKIEILKQENADTLLREEKKKIEIESLKEKIKELDSEYKNLCSKEITLKEEIKIKNIEMEEISKEKEEILEAKNKMDEKIAVKYLFFITLKKKI